MNHKVKFFITKRHLKGKSSISQKHSYRGRVHIVKGHVEERNFIIRKHPHSKRL
jgi:hypothetical protein